MRSRIAKCMLACGAIVALASTTVRAKNLTFEQVNLVSDQAEVAQIQDENLVNAWGIAFSASGAFWVNANETGKSLLYAVTNAANGDPTVIKQGLEVSIPGDGNPTGQFFDSHGFFNGDAFIFASEDGTISGWRGALGTSAEVLTQRVTAVYKGITLVTTTSNGPVILAANFAEGTVDEYNTNMTLLAQFVDTKAKTGYAPFNVQVIDGIVFVTFAKQDSEKVDDVPGKGNGIIDILDPDTGKFTRFVTGKDAGGKDKDLNSPWGLVLTPSSWGKNADKLLVGNFGDGTITIYNDNAKSKGKLKSNEGGDVTIDGLWGLTFGNGGSAGDPDILYFSAGPNGEGDGLFGSLVPAPKNKKHMAALDDL
jgi:uncharacterized protein (TIGR03118 family)